MKKFQLPKIHELVKTTKVEITQNPETPGPYYVLPFGKYQGNNMMSVFDLDTGYIDWLEKQKNISLQVQKSLEILRSIQFEYYSTLYNSERIQYEKNYTMPFGKYKNQTLQDIESQDPKYFQWMKTSVPNTVDLFEKWTILKRQILLFDANKLTTLSQISPNSTPTAPSMDVMNVQREIPINKPVKRLINDSILETLKYFNEGKTLEEIASLKVVKLQTIEDHVAKCIEYGLIERNQLLDEETCNYIIDIIVRKCDSKIDKLKPIKAECDDGEIDISYSQIKYAVAYMIFTNN